MKTSSSIDVFIPGVLIQSTEFPNTVRLYVCATLNIWVWCTHKEHSDYEINSNVNCRYHYYPKDWRVISYAYKSRRNLEAKI